MYLESKEKFVGVKPRPLLPHQKHLLAAADLIRRHGLAKEIQLDERGSMCLHGAISIAIYGAPYGPTCFGPCQASDAVRAQVVKDGREDAARGYHAADWNNAPERTAQDVIDLLIRASFIREISQ